MSDTPALAQGTPAYPAELERVWQSADGTPVTLRALRPDDLDRELAFIAGLSEETLHMRLQYSARGVNRDEAARLLQLDYRNTFAMGALVSQGPDQRLVGVSRYARVPDTDRAECAIVVADDWQGRGLGTELMRSLGTAARARGIRALEGTSLGENQRILAWARRFGFTVSTEPNSGGMLKVTLDLGSFPSLS
ncbi:MAG: GNAT family N-acetyltransferase [Steroidobacteraceae bacterium]